MALVAAGVGSAIVPEGVAKGNPDAAIRDIEIKVKREVGLAYRASAPFADALKDFVGKLQKQRAKSPRGQAAVASVKRSPVSFGVSYCSAR
jgi:DNA-binding transcriptional LysR family regulator